MKTLRQTERILRILYPVWALVGMFSLMYVPSQVVVPGDAAATAAQIASQELLFRAGIVGSLATQILFLFAVWYLYQFFEHTSKGPARVMVMLACVSVPIAMLNELTKFAALGQLDNPDQLLFFLGLNGHGITIASIFWGLWLFPLGYLIYHSGYFPKLIGVAVWIGGVGYTLGSLTDILLPDQKTLLTVFETMTFGEIVWLLWLTIRGAKWPKGEGVGSRE
ncbi:MAG: DUF4386 domain-containing protein [Haliscomenobacter sp.]|nr:DUF4386 domain-containing protein [Haliscomenobacter sp.]MBK8654783.1 DUF4386 domain-containing protein [Haliscomenobacter sp.]